ncbi:MAG: ROK family protein [bacterium]|nr:ROK family protein [Candidatus Aquidulcis frankliniae]
MITPSADATVLALDLGGTQIRAAVVRADGSRIGRASNATPVSSGPAAIVAACVSTLQQARDSARVEDAAAVARLVGVGISAPGPIDPWRGIAVEPANLGPDFPGTDLAGPISAALNLPALLEHDTKVAILGERAFGAGRGIDDLLYITISTGLGGAVISSGRLYTGPDDTGIEIGHAPITLDGPRCTCGGIGHLEAHASGVALARTGGEAAASGASPWLATWRAAHPTGRVSAKEVSEAAAAGDRVAQGLIDHALLAVSRAVAGFVNVFNPSRIIIGGSFAEAHWDALHSRIEGEIGDNSFKVPGRRVSVHPAELGGDVSLAGCHPMVVERIGNPEWERVVAAKSKGDTR